MEEEKKSLYTVLTDKIENNEQIMKNLFIIVKAQKDLEKAKEVLKARLVIPNYENLIDKNLIISKHYRSSYDFMQVPEYKKAYDELKRIEEYLKLSGHVPDKQLEIITVKRKKEI